MPIVSIPFNKGQHEEADSKLLPQGLFTTVTNQRYRKDGRLGLRYGYDFDSTSGHPTPNNVIAAAEYQPKHHVAITARSGLTGSFATRLANGVYSNVVPLAASNGQTSSMAMPSGSIGVPTRRQHQVSYAAVNGQYCVSDCVVSGNFAYGAYEAFTYGGSGDITAGKIGMVDVSTGALIKEVLRQNDNIKLVIVNGVLCAFYISGNNINMTSYTLGTLAVVTSNVTVVTAAASKAPYFDVSPGGSATEAYLVYQSAANTLTFGTVTSVGVFAALNTIATTSTFSRASITPTFNAPTDQVAIAWLDGGSFVTGNAKVTVYRRSTVSFIIATTTVNASGLCTGYPVIGPDSAQDWAMAYNVTQTGTTTSPIMEIAVTPGSGAVAHVDVYVVGKPVIHAGATWVPCTDVSIVPAAIGGGPAIRGSYFLTPTNQAITASNTIHAESRFAVDIAVPADVAHEFWDPRRNFATVSAVGTDPGLTAVLGLLPTGSDHDCGVSFFRFESGALAPVLCDASINGELYLSGSRVLSYDGQYPTEVGHASVPRLRSLTNLGGGGSGLSAGTYLYTVVREWTDALGYKHRSPPSLPLSITIAAGDQVQIVTYATHFDTVAYSGGLASQSVFLYRTEAGGSIFYLAAARKETLTADISYTDTGVTDAILRTREILYTQGARGGLSGIAENNAPPPASYICAGSSRLLLGGMENPAQVQWSKLQFSGEPMTWSNSDQWRATVTGVVTGVGELDGTWFIFTQNNIWTVVGDGPDDNGAGAFSLPQRLPASVGCVSHKSIVRTGQGLLFQSVRGFELLPRGGGDPQWIGQVVRDTLALFPYVSASAFNQVEQLVYWAVTNAAGSAGCLIVYDTRIGEWYVDTYYSRAIKALSTYDGKLVIDGSIIETSAYVDDDTGAKTTAIIPQWVMGDTRAFGATGYGRIRKATLLGEARDVSVVFSPTLEVSYDGGTTWPAADLATKTITTLAAGVGDTVELEHMPVIQMVDAMRFRGSWTTPSPTEGIVWNSLELEVYPAPGLKRQANANRT